MNKRELKAYEQKQQQNNYGLPPPDETAIKLRRDRDDLRVALEALCNASADSSHPRFAQAIAKARAVLARIKE